MKLNICKYIIPAIFGVAVASSCDSGVEEWKPGQGGNNGGTEPTTKVVWHERAYETYNAIVSNYGIRSGAKAGLFTEERGGSSTSYLWPYDGLMSGVAALNKLGYDVDYAKKIDRFQAYYRTSGVAAVGGYGSSTDGVNGGGDRFYDDNSIIGIELVEAYKQTGDTKYLDWCAQIVRFLNSGIDDTFGKALWWCESNKNQPGNESSNKPACANGYATWFLMSYYDVCPESEKAGVLSLAKDLYKWLYETLRDPEDNVYWNSKGADGIINKTKWTYNSGAMIAAGVRLYKATGNADYLTQARATADGAYSYFVRSRNGINLCYPTNDPWFTIQLVKAYIELEEHHSSCKSYLEAFFAYADHAWENARMQNGLFYEDWSGKNPNDSRDKTLLMQDAALESFAVIALYKGEKK